MTLLDKLERRAQRARDLGVPLDGRLAMIQGWDVGHSNPHPPNSPNAMYWISDWWAENADSFADHIGVLSRDKRNKQQLVDLELLKTPAVVTMPFEPTAPFGGRVPDAKGHVTRYSDSSLYDEKCMRCGATDREIGGPLNKPCPGESK